MQSRERAKPPPAGKSCRTAGFGVGATSGADALAIRSNTAMLLFPAL